MFETINLAILVASFLVAVSILTSLVSFRIGAPLLLVFLLIGLGAGEDGIGGIDFDDAYGAYFIGSVALAIILFDSGFATPFRAFRIAAAPALTLSTLGVVLTTGAFGLAAHFLLGLPWLHAFLLGAIVSSTDAAAVFFLLRVGGIRLRDRVRSTLEIESGSNDPVAIFLTITLVEMIVASETESAFSWALASSFALQIGLGLAIGLAGGAVIVQTLNRLRLEQALYPIIALALALFLFAAVSMLGGSGFLAVYVAGLLAGNMRVRQGEALRRFQSGMTWLSQITMFLTLGLLATPSEFPQVVLPAVALALFLMFVARPLAVWLCLLPFRFDRYETAFVGWVGLRGAVSILLAVLPRLGGVEYGHAMFNVAFVIVLTSLVVQGWSIRPVARWLGLVVPATQGPVDRVELPLPGDTNHEIVTYRVHPESPVGQGERIPRWARPTLTVRDGRSLRPGTAGRPQPGDTVHIVTIPAHVHLLDRLFAAPADVDGTDAVLYGDFPLAPETALADIGRTYGFEIPEGDAGLTAVEILRTAFGRDVEPGDRYPYGPLEFVVRGIDEDHTVTAIGISLEPAPPSRPRLPPFPVRDDLLRWLRRKVMRRRD